MFEGGGVEDDLGAVLFEDVGQCVGVGDGGEDGGVVLGVGVVEGAIDFVESVCGGIEEQEAGGLGGVGGGGEC